MTTQVSVLSLEWRSWAMRGIEFDRTVIVKPTEKRPNSDVAKTIHWYRGLASTRFVTLRRRSNGHGMICSSSAPGASTEKSSGPGTGGRLPTPRHLYAVCAGSGRRVRQVCWGGCLIAAAGEHRVQQDRPSGPCATFCALYTDHDDPYRDA